MQMVGKYSYLIISSTIEKSVLALIPYLRIRLFDVDDIKP